MNKEQYEEKMKLIEKSFDDAKKTLYKEYALANNPYKVNDIIKDHIGRLQIKMISVHKSVLSLPQCVYYGVQLNKDLSISKRQDHTFIYQQNILK